MNTDYTNDYLLDKQVKIFQPVNGYRASTDAVLLAAMVKTDAKNLRILDVGSGTGAVSLCLAQRLQQHNVEIHGLEIQPELAKLANMSAQANGFDFLYYHQADIRQKINTPNLLPCSFDIVVTNPPYSTNDMPSPNQSKATAHNLDELNLEAWIKFCLKMLKPFGHLYLINRAEALPQICTALQNRAGSLKILPLYSKSTQIAKRVIVSAQKDSKTQAQILPPFTVHLENGEYTAVAQQILRQGLGFANVEN